MNTTVTVAKQCRRIRWTTVLVNALGVLVGVYLLYRLHVLATVAVMGGQGVVNIHQRSVPDDSLAAEIQNVVARSDGKLEIQLVVSIEQLVKQMGRLYRQDTVDESTLPRPTRYTMNNPDMCRNVSNLRVIVYLHSAPGNADRRGIIRNTWANMRLFRHSFFRVVFLIGKAVSEAQQTALNNEFRIHKDIVQGDFHDDYKNLTLKAIMGLQWITEYCPNAKFALKSDDDAFINIFGYLDLIDSHPDPSHMISCAYYTDQLMPVLRFPKLCSRWCIKYHELVGQLKYPGYCAGIAFLLSADIIPAMYEASRSTPFFWVDDVYITGILAGKVGGVRYQQLGLNLSLNGRDAYDQYVKAKPGERLTYIMAHGQTVKQMLEMWEMLLRKLSPEHAQMIADDAIEHASHLRKGYIPGTLLV